eukprot:scaffold74950_cov70-Cyclotella_meneghiniana.AAC.3
MPMGDERQDKEDIGYRQPRVVGGDKLSFDCEYFHVVAHQDERKAYLQLARPTQLKCFTDITAKNVLWGLVGETVPPQGIFPLEPVAVVVGREKLMSGSEDILQFWCQKKEAREVLSQQKVRVLQPGAFEEVDWRAVYQTLNEVPRMFQIWACNHASRSVGLTELTRCKPESGRVVLVHKSIDLVEQWMKDQETEPTLRKVLIEYAHGRGGETMLGEIVGIRGGRLRQLARLMDKIGWCRFMVGIV